MREIASILGFLFLSILGLHFLCFCWVLIFYDFYSCKIYDWKMKGRPTPRDNFFCFFFLKFCNFFLLVSSRVFVKGQHPIRISGDFYSS